MGFEVVRTWSQGLAIQHMLHGMLIFCTLDVPAEMSSQRQLRGILPATAASCCRVVSRSMLQAALHACMVWQQGEAMAAGGRGWGGEADAV